MIPSAAARGSRKFEALEQVPELLTFGRRGQVQSRGVSAIHPRSPGCSGDAATAATLSVRRLQAPCSLALFCSPFSTLLLFFPSVTWRRVAKGGFRVKAMLDTSAKSTSPRGVFHQRT
jgi:hypothetical protein